MSTRCTVPLASVTTPAMLDAASKEASIPEAVSPVNTGMVIAEFTDAELL